MRKKRIFQVRSKRPKRKNEVLKLIILSEMHEERSKITINEQRRHDDKREDLFRLFFQLYTKENKTKKMNPIDRQTDKNKNKKETRFT